MQEVPKVFSSDITRGQKSLQNNLYDLLSVVPAQPIAVKQKKQYSCEYQPKIDKCYTPKKRNKLKVKTVRDIRDVFEKDIYSYLPNDLEQQRNILLKKITGGSSSNECTKVLANNLLKSQNPISRTAWQMLMNLNPEGNAHCIQFVLWNGKRIRVTGSKGGKSKFLFNYDLANKTVPSQAKSFCQNKCILKKKGLLRNSLTVKFKPGPLTKKKFLDDSYQKYSVGDTELVNLPKSKLELQPTYGIVLEPTITNFLHNLREVDGKITKKWAEFAVSVLGTLNSTSAVQNEALPIVTFDLNYKSNRRRILMRRDVCDSTFEMEENYNANSIQPSMKDEMAIISEVRTVINNILDSVEISLQQDNMYSGEDDTRELPPNDATKDNPNNFHPKEKLKRNLELDRLDVTVIRLPYVSQGENIETCRKSHCALGCVCSSLQCDYTFKQHCGRIECMFECKCDFSKYKVTEALEDSCSELIPGLFNLNNKINLQLAKEEQKFHQTVVVTGEKSILLKSERRNWKASKRYADFYCDMNLKVDMKTERVLSVIDVKLNCENIEPWCMVHNLYQCFCKGKFTSSTSDKVCELSVVNETIVHNEEPSNKAAVVNDKEITRRNTLRNRMRAERSRTNVKKLSVSEPLISNFSNLPDMDIDTCARINPYKGRKYYDPYYISTHKKILEMEKNDNKLHRKMMDLISNMKTNDTILHDPDNFIESTNTSRNTSLTEHEEILKLQRQSTFNLSPPSSTDNAIVDDAIVDDAIVEDAIVDDAIVDVAKLDEGPTLSAFSTIDTAADLPKSNISSKPTPKSNKSNLISWLELNYKHYKERSERGVVKTSLEPPKHGKMGLYPWEFILSRYKERKNLFLITKQPPYRVFMAVNDKNRFFDNCINIDDIRFADLHKYPATAKNLLTNASDLEDNFCILRGLTHCWEWIGSANVKNTAGSLRSPQKPQVPNLNQALSDIIPTHEDQVYSDNLSSAAVVMDYDMDEINENTTEVEGNAENSKWFVMTVENDFTEIQFNKRGFYVKYESIIKAINVANMSGKTVCLSSQKCTEQNSSPQFGIYAIPNDNEYCVFVGPYEKEDCLGIEIVKTISDVRKLQRTRGIWITTKKVDNLKVIDNPLSFIPQNKYNSDNLVTLETDSTLHTTGEKVNKRTISVAGSNDNETGNSPTTSKINATKFVKPIKIRRTNGFYHLAPKSFLNQMTSPSLKLPSLLKDKQISIPEKDLEQIYLQNPNQNSQSKRTVNPPPLLLINYQTSIINRNSLLITTNALPSTSENMLPQQLLLNVGNKKPVAEIAPQIKIIDVYSESGAVLDNKNVETKKPEGGMFVLKPEEINKRLMQNKGLDKDLPTESEKDCIKVYSDPYMSRDIENFLANSERCTLPNSDIYVISDDEEACNDANKNICSYEDVLIECTNIENLGWIRGRRNVMDQLSFEFPGFKYTDFYTKEEAFSKINQVLSRKIYVPKSLDLEWQVIESEEDLNTKHLLNPDQLGADFVLTKRGPRHKKDLVKPRRHRSALRKKNTGKQISEPVETIRQVASDENDEDPDVGVEKMSDLLKDLEKQSRTSENEGNMLDECKKKGDEDIMSPITYKKELEINMSCVSPKNDS